jgi:NADH-quinone oxidoreductase subunit C
MSERGSDIFSAAQALADVIRQAIPSASVTPAAAIDMPTLDVAREHIVEVCRVLRDDPSLQFALLAEVTAADLLPAEPRYEVVYHLACLGPAFAQPGGAAPARRLRLRVWLAGDDPVLPSVTPIYPTAGWLERELFDLFGIVFDRHPDLRRILMTDDWEGHPLRKDYPVQIRKDTTSWSAIQMTPEEFAASVRAARDRAKAEIDQELGKR